MNVGTLEGGLGSYRPHAYYLDRRDDKKMVQMISQTVIKTGDGANLLETFEGAYYYTDKNSGYTWNERTA
jgi:hypothetical protein